MTDPSSISSALRAGLTPSFRATVGRAHEASENKNKAPGLLMKGPVFRETLLDAIVTTLTPVVEQMLQEQLRVQVAAFVVEAKLLAQRADQAERRLSEMHETVKTEVGDAICSLRMADQMVARDPHAQYRRTAEMLESLLALLDAGAGPGEK